MKQDRFLTGILIGIGVLALAAVGVFFLRQGAQGYIADDTPDGVVHNYVFALYQGDLDLAYGYLADMDGKPDWKDFQTEFEDFSGSRRGMQIVEVDLEGDKYGYSIARVELNIVSVRGGLFDESYVYNDDAILVNQEGEWKLIEMPYDFWDRDWYEIFRDNF